MAFPPAQRNELQSDPSGLSLALVLVTEGLQDSGQQEHTMVSFTSKHQDRILSLVIKTGSLLQAWTMPSFITLTVGKVRLLCASTLQPLLKRASVRGAGVGRLCLSCHLSQGGLGGMGFASGNKWLQRSSCLLPQHMALRCLCWSKTVTEANEILV